MKNTKPKRSAAKNRGLASRVAAIGRKYLEAGGRTGTAVKALKQLLKKHPECAEAWVFLARMWIVEGKHARARKCLEKAEALDAYCHPVSFERADIAKLEGKRDLFIDEYVNGVKKMFSEFTALSSVTTWGLPEKHDPRLRKLLAEFLECHLASKDFKRCERSIRALLRSVKMEDSQ